MTPILQYENTLKIMIQKQTEKQTGNERERKKKQIKSNRNFTGSIIL